MNISHALRSLSFGADSLICDRIVDCGLLKTILSQCMTTNFDNAEESNFAEGLFVTIENIISTSAKAVKEIEVHSLDFVSFLIHLFGAGNRIIFPLIIFTISFFVDSNREIGSKSYLSSAANVLSILSGRSATVLSNIREQETNLLWTFLLSVDVVQNAGVDFSMQKGINYGIDGGELYSKKWTVVLRLFDVFANASACHSWDEDKFRSIIFIIRSVINRSNTDFVSIQSEDIAIVPEKAGFRKLLDF